MKWRTKARIPTHRLFPPSESRYWGDEGDPRADFYDCSSQLGWPRRETYNEYQLLPADIANAGFQASKEKAEHPNLEGMIKYHRFGLPPRRNPLFDADHIAENFSLVLRRDRVSGARGYRLAFLSRLHRVSGLSGWMVARLTWDFHSGGSIEGVVTPSASRWFDWYVSPGGMYLDQEHQGFFSSFDFKPELGIKVRAGRDELGVVGKVIKVLFPFGKLGRFIGLRLGLRAEGLERILSPGKDDPNLKGIRGVRFVWEVGGGAW